MVTCRHFVDTICFGLTPPISFKVGIRDLQYARHVVLIFNLVHISCIIIISFSVSQHQVHYYNSDDPHNCPFFSYFGYYEETPSNSHLYMYKKKKKTYQRVNRKHKGSSGDDDYEDHTTHDGDADVDICATGLGLMSLYDPCASHYFTESDSQGKTPRHVVCDIPKEKRAWI